MSERSLRYLQKSDFGGTRSRTGKRKPNQLYVCDTTTQWFDWPRGPHFNKLPVQLIQEIFKYLLAYELLTQVSLVCKYWYNLCRDKSLWTSITWNGTQRTLEKLLRLTKYPLHELVLTDNLCYFSDIDLARVLKICTHLKCLKLPKNACRELFKRELPRTNIHGGKPYHQKDINLYGAVSSWTEAFHYAAHFYTGSRGYFCRTLDLMLGLNDASVHLNRSVEDSSLAREFDFILGPVDDSSRARRCATDIEIALASVKHKRFLTAEEFLAKHKKVYRFSNELASSEHLLRTDRESRSAIFYENSTKAPCQSCIRKIPFQDCRMNRRQQQPNKIKPRPPKGRNNHHKEVKKFRRLQKRFKLYSLK